MKIRYKVIKHRKSCVIPQGSKYCLSYKKDQIVKAVPGSLGIMVFKTLLNAQCFETASTKIIKVRPIGRRRKISIFSTCMLNARRNTFMFKNFYKIYSLKKRYKDWPLKFFNITNIVYPPEGTECYSAVEVLE